MSIVQVGKQFEAAVAGTDIKLAKVTMGYREDDRSIQRFSFRVSKNKGATTTIDIECTNAAGIPAMVLSAAEQAKAWVATND